MKYLRLKLFLLMVCIGVLAYTVAAQEVTFEAFTPATLPWDAVPSPDGSMIYYTAISADGTPGVFSITGAGNEPVLIATGKPLVTPLGIAMSSDGQMLYVTDPWASGKDGNGVYAVSTAGGMSAELVAGTKGTAPYGIEVVNQAGVDQIYFTGIDITDGQAAVYKVAASGGTAEILAKGMPLVAPSGIAVAQDGTVYVLDHLASGNGLGAVIKIQGTSMEIIASDVLTGGQLAGLTLPMDESALLVSSLSQDTGTAQVLVINLATLETSIINDVIGVNTAAGGLHRAHNANIFAWADSTGGFIGGTIYRVGLK